jgi:hypothetical protein
MIVEIKMAEPEHNKLGVYVVNDASSWPELLDTFLAALIAASFVLNPTSLYDTAIAQLTERRNAIAEDAAQGE